MSCISAISTQLTPEQMELAKKQKFKFSMPAWRPSMGTRLDKMIESTNIDVRRAAAANYRLSFDQQWTLCHDRDWSVRATLAKNPRISAGVLFRLASDDNERVRGQVVLNSSTPQAVVDYIVGLESTTEKVRSLAEWRKTH